VEKYILALFKGFSCSFKKTKTLLLCLGPVSYKRLAPDLLLRLFKPIIYLIDICCRCARRSIYFAKISTLASQKSCSPPCYAPITLASSQSFILRWVLIN